MDRILEFAGAHPLLVFGLLTSFLLVVFSEIRRKAGNLLSIESADAVKLINNDAAVIDLRSNESFARGHIVNARNVPLDELDAKTIREIHRNARGHTFIGRKEPPAAASRR